MRVPLLPMLKISRAEKIVFIFRGFESETDTEEFEKVGQSPVELVFDERQTRTTANAPGNTVEVGVQCQGSQDAAVQCSQLSFWRRSRSSQPPLACAAACAVACAVACSGVCTGSSCATSACAGAAGSACAASSLEAGVQCHSMDTSFSLCDDTPRGSFVETGVQVKGAPSTPSTDSGIQCDAFRSSPTPTPSPAVLSNKVGVEAVGEEAFAFGFANDAFRFGAHDKSSDDSRPKADTEHVQVSPATLCSAHFYISVCARSLCLLEFYYLYFEVYSFVRQTDV